MLNNYNNFYKKSNKVFGCRPTDYVVDAATILNGSSSLKVALDIGAGQGRDSMFLLEAGFHVTAIDQSVTAYQQLNALHNSNLTAINTDIYSFDIKPRQYDLVLLINVLHFMDKEKAIRVIARAKHSLKVGGIMIISILLDNGKFKPGELKSLFLENSYDILKYVEINQFDPGHVGHMSPHNHLIAKIMAIKN